MIADRIAVMNRGRIEQIGTAGGCLSPLGDGLRRAASSASPTCSTAQVSVPRRRICIKVRVDADSAKPGARATIAQRAGAAGAACYVRPEQHGASGTPKPGMNAIQGQASRGAASSAPRPTIVVDVNGVALRVIGPSRQRRLFNVSQDVLVSFAPADCLLLPRPEDKSGRKAHASALADLPGGARAVDRRTRIGPGAAAPSMDELLARPKARGPGRYSAAPSRPSTPQSSRPRSASAIPASRVKYTRRSTEPMVQLIEAERRAGKRELRRAQSHRAGRHGALEEGRLPGRSADPGHRQDAARRPSTRTASTTALGVTPMSASTAPRRSSQATRRSRSRRW